MLGLPGRECHVWSWGKEWPKPAHPSARLCQGRESHAYLRAGSFRRAGSDRYRFQKYHFVEEEWWGTEELKFLLCSTEIMKCQKLKLLELMLPCSHFPPHSQRIDVFTEKNFVLHYPYPCGWVWSTWPWMVQYLCAFLNRDKPAWWRGDLWHEGLITRTLNGKGHREVSLDLYTWFPNSSQSKHPRK